MTEAMQPMKAIVQHQRNRATKGFTLVELLAVMCIILIMTALISPSVSSTVRGTNVNRAGTMVIDYLALARQEAVSMNRDVQVRFVEKLDGSQMRTCGIQLLRVDESASGSVTKAITRITWFPEQIAINLDERFSPLLANPTISGTNYRGFRIKANGKLDSNSDKPFLTIQNINDSPTMPKNFFTIRVHPLTGRTTVFRP